MGIWSALFGESKEDREWKESCRRDELNRLERIKEYVSILGLTKEDEQRAIKDLDYSYKLMIHCLTIKSAESVLGYTREQAVQEIFRDGGYDMDLKLRLVGFANDFYGMTTEQTLYALNDPEFFNEIKKHHDMVAQGFQSQCTEAIINSFKREVAEAEARANNITKQAEENLYKYGRIQFVGLDNGLYEKDEAGYIYERYTGKIVGKDGYSYGGQRLNNY